ncbi:unnamed protein product [Phytophthora fragariaefolia]|uniref:Unnamed protein product n=1 Tax=Phytophthora fragariaefolia TaxID=1490495 RepID=A0A9W6TZD0_9STRA|nr:unnamed protein product [Phytophthora fragariaefolia]
MEQELRSTFLLANVAYLPCCNFLRCKQAKRSLQDYVMELHNLETAMAGAPLSQDVKVTVFKDGVRTGPVWTELFRRQPKTFYEAVHIAMLEDHCVHSAQYHTSHVEASEGPTPMDVSLAESARPPRTQRAGVRWFGCNQPSHFRRNCPTNPWKVTRDKNVARNNALYASALEASKSNTNVSVCLATGSIMSTRMVIIPLRVKFDDFNSIEPFIVLDMDDRYDLIFGMPWLAKHEPWIDWLATQGADAAAARAGQGGSARAPPPTQSVAAGPVHVEECAGVVASANESVRVGTPTTQGFVAGSARSTEGAGACVHATAGGQAGAPTSKVIRSDKVTSTPKAEASRRDADSAAEGKVSQVLDAFAGEPKVGEA